MRATIIQRYEIGMCYSTFFKGVIIIYSLNLGVLTHIFESKLLQESRKLNIEQLLCIRRSIHIL